MANIGRCAAVHPALIESSFTVDMLRAYSIVTGGCGLVRSRSFLALGPRNQRPVFASKQMVSMSCPRLWPASGGLVQRRNFSVSPLLST